ncbi:A24 family peptidase [Pseudomonas sp. NW5]|uniref:A24 family peptidase n=1 Tax=Pseudomonas sp. NW5 TaxID=2934934 RepID=UPI0020218BE6|nr:A24 family peptidase [Pseudomonas sp. NW5]MCL7461212.1 A24 family peptidase [Pseudomonas sp. NW5]
MIFLAVAALHDLRHHRLPNLYLLAGLCVALALQFWQAGGAGLAAAGGGFLLGLLAFLPFYIRGGMAAGDVKLMAVVGAFIGGWMVLWAALCSLLAGSLLALGYLLWRGQLASVLGRYWASAGLRRYIPATDDSAARHRFPYALAIAVGTVCSLYLPSPLMPLLSRFAI